VHPREASERQQHGEKGEPAVVRGAPAQHRDERGAGEGELGAIPVADAGEQDESDDGDDGEPSDP
jgi:hypothetical protein